ncbi:hypothetical protein IFM89_012438 [Coptis chinensis]|uniref:Uncharacterized protein n=1 Tax=Coptis chinensis TaxID=261450 RepID=A0A835I9B8_9MAGN|nr:hypothetical protein IFM89_012438 [Coptis chinensis]
MRPSGTPRAVLALRGTLLKDPTIRRDIEDDLRFLAWESLKSSVRFSTTLEALKLIVEKYGRNPNVHAKAADDSNKENTNPSHGQAAAKLFVMSKGKQKFLDAHGLVQWWSDDVELQLTLHNSKLISGQIVIVYPPPDTNSRKGSITISALCLC